MTGARGILRPESVGGPTSFPPDDPRDRFLRERGYETHIYRTDSGTSPGNGLRQAEQTFRATGDHLTVLAIEGGSQLAIRIGARSNKFLPIRAGDVLTREFEAFTVRMLDTPAANDIARPWTMALLVSSYGPLIQRLPPDLEFKPGFFSNLVTANVAGVDILSDAALSANWALSSISGIPSFLRYGGRLRLHNRSAVNSAFFYYGNPNNGVAPFTGSGAVNTGAWEILPGQKEEFVFSSGPRFSLKIPDPNDKAPWSGSLFVQTLAGTADVACLFSSSSRDYSDPDIGVTGVRTFPWGG